MKFSEYILNSSKIIEQTPFCQETATYKVQRDVTPKVSIQELWFLHSACRLMLVNICISFMKIFWTVLKLQSERDFVLETTTYKVQRV